MTFITITFVGLAVLCWGTGSFLDKLILRYLDAGNVFIAKLVATIVIFLPLVLWKLVPFKKAVENGGRISMILVFLSVIFTMSGVYFYLKAMAGGEASSVVPLSSTYPLITFVLVCFFLGESFTTVKLVGTLLVCSGVFFLSK
ncbi:MAG: EamA family transporter [Elusimicrobiales bacterium]|nr:EamA family transporter [Elusimicrobiales bacterium]MCK5582540.1 EamA family transporter [Elusimicrobiales bacterium]